MGKVLFSQVCVRPHGGTQVPGSFPGLWSQVPFGGYPSPRFFPRFLVPGPFWGDPVLGSFTGLWSQVLSRWYPVLARGTPGQGYPKVRTALGYLSPQPGLGYPPSRTGVQSLARTGLPRSPSLETQQQSDVRFCQKCLVPKNSIHQAFSLLHQKANGLTVSWLTCATLFSHY